jgi:hypothetical protein
MLHLHLPRINFIFSLVAITVLSFFCIENAAARYDPYLSDPNTSFFGRLIILNDELTAAGGQEAGIQQTVLLEALLQPFDLRGSRPTPTNRVSLQPSNLPTASGGGRNLSRDGLCAVGYQDSGFFTPFHAFRWTKATMRWTSAEPQRPIRMQTVPSWSGSLVLQAQSMPSVGRKPAAWWISARRRTVDPTSALWV